jgi:hypothetical protein
MNQLELRVEVKYSGIGRARTKHAYIIADHRPDIRVDYVSQLGHPQIPSTMLSRASLCFVVFFLCAIANAQFNFFDGMFRQQQQEQPSGASMWAAHLESGTCCVCILAVLSSVIPAFQSLAIDIYALPLWTVSGHQLNAHAPTQKTSNARYQTASVRMVQP